MANVVIFKTGKTPQYLRSVNTPDYEGDSDVLVNPDISSVERVDIKFWKRSRNSVVEMSVAEKKVITDAERVKELARADELEVEAIDLAKALIAAGVVTKTVLTNKLREVL